MIKIKNKIGSPVPEILLSKGTVATENLIKDREHGATEFVFDAQIYGNKQVKEELIKLQNDKCCFCEAKIGHISYGDVEHFRPKGGWVQNNEPLNKPGYYWLAYDWDNLLLSCQLCNQRHKKNSFPLITENTRAYNHNYNIENEDPLFVHPVKDNPEDHIEFNDEIPVNISERGLATIEKLGLDRKPLNERRREKLNAIALICNLAKGHPDTNQKDAAKAFLQHCQSVETEYASMLRCFFKKYPINF